MGDGGRRAPAEGADGGAGPFAGKTAVLFDLDGTLIYTHIDFALMRSEVARLAVQFGVEPSVEPELDVLAMVEAGRSRLVASGHSDRAAEFARDALSRLEEIEEEQCGSPVQAPGASELLRRLRESGIAVGIVTRNSRRVSERLVRSGGLLHDVLLTRDDVPRPKPDPDHLARALEQMSQDGACALGRAVMVGDHWLDVAAGQAAGCATVGLLRGRDESFFAGATPDYVEDEVGALLRFLPARSSTITRRAFVALGGAAGLATAGAEAASAVRPAPGRLPAHGKGDLLHLRDLPSFCSHEHWGSIGSFGMEAEGFRADVVRGATPLRPTGLFDLLLDPYFGGWLASSGVDHGAVAAKVGQTDLRMIQTEAVATAWGAFRQAIAHHVATGTYQAMRVGMRELYGHDIEKGADPSGLDGLIREAYADTFGWYRRAARKVGLAQVIRPVHPEYLWRSAGPVHAAAEDGLIRTVLRIDPLLHLWQAASPRRDALAGELGVDPGDAATWRRFLVALADRAAARGVVGIKQLQAYSRDLAYDEHPDSEVRFRGELAAAEVRVFQDWVMHECCKLAHERGWPHQVHVGTHNLPHSSPLPLAGLAARYRRMPLVLLHCWPFIRECGWLAWTHPNVFTDTCWLGVLNPAYLREALNTWTGLVPSHKIMCGHDATSIEMAAGSVTAVRDALGDVLSEQCRRGAMTEANARDMAADLLARNAERLYGVRPA